MHSSKKIRLLKIAVSITCVIVMLFAVSGISSYAAGVSNEIQPVETIPLVIGYRQLPQVTFGYHFNAESSFGNYGEFLIALLEVTTGSDSPFRYRFHGSDAINYISGFFYEYTDTDTIRIYASDGFLPQATFAIVTLSPMLNSIQLEDVDFVCVSSSIDEGIWGDYYALALSGLAYPLEQFVDYGSGGGTTPTCPTLQEQLSSYTGTFGNIVSMLNTKNYGEYVDASTGIYNDGYDLGYDEGYSDAVGLRGTLQAGQIRLFDEVLDFSAFSEDNPPLAEYTYTDSFNYHIFGGYNADYMTVQYTFDMGYQSLYYTFSDDDSGGYSLISRTTTNSIPDTTWIVPRGRLIVIDSMPDDPRFVQFIEDNSSIIDGVQATTLYNYGYGIGFNDGWTDSAIGDAFKAPIDALNNIVLLETAGVTITLGGVILAMISMSIMIVFLKKFAGG